MTEYQEAKYYSVDKDKQLKCELCPHHCIIKEDKTGICKVRKNIKGELKSLNYGKVSALRVDPIEKKPLYHFYPAKEVLSIGSYGCNLSCSYCQNWQISQQKPPLKDYSPQAIINTAQKKELDLIAYTYSEPTVFYEYMLDTAKLASKKGIKNILVSNGFIEEEPLKELTPYLAAANIDLKSFQDHFYKKHCQGGLDAVKKTIRYLADKIHLEVTTLVISDLNDDLDELQKIFNFLAEIDQDIPLHLSRYYPAYKLDNPATDLNLMEKAYQLAKKDLNNVYLGNVNLENSRDSFCSNCGDKVIKRSGYGVIKNYEAGFCKNCGSKIYGEFE